MQPENSTLFIGDLSVTCTEAQLLGLFLKCGGAISVRIIKTRKQASLGYAFVNMINGESALNAISHLNGTMLCGRNIRVCLAEDDKRHHFSVSGHSMLGASVYATADQSYGSVEDAHNVNSTISVPNMHFSTNSNSPFYSSNEDNTHVSREGHSAHGESGNKKHENSIYFKFQCPLPLTTNEGVLRDLITSCIGENSVSDITIRRITEEGVSIWRHVTYCYSCVCI